MGTQIPAAGVISDSGNTTAEQKQLFEDLCDILRRIPGVGAGTETATISGGAISGTVRGVLKVANEGGAATDILDTISVTPYHGVSIIILQAATPANTTTLNHAAGGSGELILDGSADFDLTGERRIWLQLTPANKWNELFRTYGSDVASQRAYLGLGTAATHDEGTGNGLDADTLDGSHASAFLGVAAKAADSELLDGLNSTAFARKDQAAQQDFVHNLLAGQGRFVASHALGQTAGLEMHINAAMLARLIVDDQASDVLSLDLYASPGGALHRSIRLVNGLDHPQFYDGTAQREIWHEANDGAASGLDADLVHGISGESIYGTTGIGEYTTSWAAGFNGNAQVVTVPSAMCWAPRVVTDTPGVNARVEGYMSGLSGGVNEYVTKFVVTTERASGSSGSIAIYVRYVDGNPPTNF